MSSWFFKGLARIVGLFPWRWVQKTGAALGLAWFHVVRIRRRVVLGNLSMALPDLNSEHMKIARNAYKHFGVSAFEFLKMNSMSGEDVAARVSTRGMEYFEKVFAQKRGVIVVTAHFGNFDLLACSQAARGLPLAIVSRDLHGKGANRFWMETRKSYGLVVFPEKSSARQLVSWLRSGMVVGLVVDQRTPPEKGGIKDCFMGREAWTTTTPAKLAIRTGAALLPVRIERRADGDHDVIVEPEISVPKKFTEEGVSLVTRCINEIVSGWVRLRPDHWMWLHRRFADIEKPEKHILKKHSRCKSF